MKNHLFDFLDEVEGLPVGSTTANIEKEKRRQGYGEKIENGYIALYKGKRLEVYASTSYEAQKKAALIFRAKKSYQVDVTLCEKNGEPVTISTSAL